MFVFFLVIVGLVVVVVVVVGLVGPGFGVEHPGGGDGMSGVVEEGSVEEEGRGVGGLVQEQEGCDGGGAGLQEGGGEGAVVGQDKMMGIRLVKDKVVGIHGKKSLH